MLYFVDRIFLDYSWIISTNPWIMPGIIFRESAVTSTRTGFLVDPRREFAMIGMYMSGVD